MLTKMLEANEAGYEVYEILKNLKPYIVKGRKPKPVDPNARLDKGIKKK